MNRFVVDSWSWVEYLNGTENGMKVKFYIEKKENKLFTSIISLSEVVSLALRRGMDISVAENDISSNSEITGIDNEIAVNAGIFHGEMRRKVHDFGLDDAFVAVAARQLGAKILTGDPHFKHIKEAIMI